MRFFLGELELISLPTRTVGPALTQSPLGATVSATEKDGSWDAMDKGRLARNQVALEARTPLPEFAKKMKRTEPALRRKAGILGIGLGYRR